MASVINGHSKPDSHFRSATCFVLTLNRSKNCWHTQGKYDIQVIMNMFILIVALVTSWPAMAENQPVKPVPDARLKVFQPYILEFHPVYYRCDYRHGKDHAVTKKCTCFTVTKHEIKCPPDDPQLKTMTKCLSNQTCSAVSMTPRETN